MLLSVLADRRLMAGQTAELGAECACDERAELGATALCDEPHAPMTRMGIRAARRVKDMVSVPVVAEPASPSNLGLEQARQTLVEAGSLSAVRRGALTE